MSKDIRELISDPMANWPNDDLMMSQIARSRVKEAFPSLFRIADWPSVRELFREHEIIAVAKKSEVKKRGQMIVILGVAGLAFAATTGLFADSPITAAVIGGIAAAFSMASLAFGAMYRLNNPARLKWLHSRYVTERLRHFYYQFFLANSHNVVRAMSNPELCEKILAKRDNSFSAFKFNRVGLQSTPLRYQELIQDVAEARNWIEEAGEQPVHWSADFDLEYKNELMSYFGFMRTQRIGVQNYYAKLKETRSIFSSKLMYRIANIGVDVLTIIIMSFALLVGLDSVLTFTLGNGFLNSTGGVSNFLGSVHQVLPGSNVLIAAGAITAAIVAGLRAFTQGMRLREESERYNWYSAAVSEIQNDFDEATNNSERFSALLHLEKAAYRETRAFMHSHQTAKFFVD